MSAPGSAGEASQDGGALGEREESEGLYVFRDPEPRSGPDNMARDSALLERYGRGERLVLRWYGWLGTWHSVGYFQRDREALLRASGVSVVRRRTGGGEVVHDAVEATYALIIPSEHAWSRRGASEIYHRVHGCLAEALSAHGSRCGLAADTGSPGRPGGCFTDAAVAGDVIDAATGVKRGGAAMRRSHGAVLLQGSVRSGLDEGVRWQSDFAELLSDRAEGAAGVRSKDAASG